MRNISYLIKPASSLCNLRCKYCFYENESINREKASFGVMNEETALNVINKGYQSLDGQGHISFAFQGGEPTTAGIDFFKFFVNEAKRLKPDNVDISFSIQTNGILIDDEWAKFFKKENFLVGLSIDGNKKLHNKYRVYSNNKETFDRVICAMETFKRHKVDFNALCVVTKDCAQNPKAIYESLKRLGFEYMQFIGCLDFIEVERGSLPWSLSPEDYGKFLCELFDLWYEDWEKGHYHSIRLFDDYINILLNSPYSTCATCGRCGGYFVIEANGDVYPCDFFCLDNWKVGNINFSSLDELRTSSKFEEFLAFGKDKPTKCLNCKYRRLCNGGCKNDWIKKEDQYENYYCSSFYQLFEHAYPRMRYIAEQELLARTNKY